MWLYLVGIVLVVLGLAGLAAGGIFTLVLLPLGLIVIATAAGYGVWQRAAQSRAGAETDAHPTTNRPLPHNPQRQSGHVETSPEALADARRVQQ
jgi:hypothetical protein